MKRYNTLITGTIAAALVGVIAWYLLNPKNIEKTVSNRPALVEQITEVSAEKSIMKQIQSGEIANNEQYINLENLVNAKGEKVFDNKRLAGILDAQVYYAAKEHGFNESIATYLSAGGTFEQAKELNNIMGYWGNFFNKQSIVKYALRKKEGKDYDLKTIKEFVGFGLRRYTPCFNDAGYLLFYLDEGGSMEELKKTITQFNWMGRPAIYNGKAQALFKNCGGNAEKLEKILEVKHKGREILGSDEFIIPYLCLGGTIEILSEIPHIKDHKGNLVFYSEEHILELVRSKRSADLTNIVSKRNLNGESVFQNGLILARYLKAGGTDEYVDQWISEKNDFGEPYSGYEIYRFFQLGLKPSDLEFKDTDKPNAVVVYTRNDPNTGLENKESVRFLENIRRTYDTRLVFTTSNNPEAQLYWAIDNTPNSEFLDIAGHPVGKKIYLGGEPFILPFSSDTIPDEDTIDRTDFEIEHYLSKLHPDAVILLSSCSAKNGKDSIYSFINKRAGGRRVIASEFDFSMQQRAQKRMDVHSYYPFDAEFINETKSSK